MGAEEGNGCGKMKKTRPLDAGWIWLTSNTLMRNCVNRWRGGEMEGGGGEEEEEGGREGGRGQISSVLNGA